MTRRKPKPAETITLLTPQAIQERLKGRSVTEVIAGTGMSQGAVYRWRRGEITDPNLSHWKLLSDYLTGGGA